MNEEEIQQVKVLQDSADEHGIVDHTLPEFKQLVDYGTDRWKSAIDLLGKEDWENEDY